MPEKQIDQPTSYYDEGRTVSERAKRRLQRLRDQANPNKKHDPYLERSGMSMSDKKDQTKKLKGDAW